jgi:hypothetical protein
LPVTGVRQQVIETKKTFFVNDFISTSWQDDMPRVNLQSATLSLTPLLLRDEAVGMIAFANKHGVFERAI